MSRTAQKHPKADVEHGFRIASCVGLSHVHLRDTDGLTCWRLRDSRTHYIYISKQYVFSSCLCVHSTVQHALTYKYSHFFFVLPSHLQKHRLYEWLFHEQCMMLLMADGMFANMDRHQLCVV